MKTCRTCKAKFEPFNSLQRTCSVPCAIEDGQNNLQRAAKSKAKEQRQWIREQKKRLKTRSDWTKDAQREFNKFIRLRDHYRPCISCGTYTAGQFHAGHYRTTKAAPELRFEELNCHKQCAQCNNFDSGNIVEYRINLVQRLGQETVDWLEGPHEPKKYTIQDLERITKYYRREARELERKAA